MKAESDAQGEVVTRGTKTAWIFWAVAGLTVSTAFATFAIGLDRMALWQVVRACVADFKLTGAPFPCLEVDLSGGEERGNVVLRPRCRMTRSWFRREGSSGLKIRSCCRQGPRTISTPHGCSRVPQGPGRTCAGSRRDRARRQLCRRPGPGPAPHPPRLPRPSARRALAAAAPNVPMGEWARIGAVVPHTTFWGFRIRGTDLPKVEPFRLAAEALAGKAKGQAT